MSFTLRSLTFEDIETIGRLEDELFPTDAWPLDMFYTEFFQPETRRYIVAEVDGVPVGYAGVMVIDTTADIQTIGVLPRFEGQMATWTSSRTRGQAETVMLEVRADNPRAQELYSRFGFVKIHTRKRYYRDGVDAWVMRLVLAADGGTR